MDMTLSKGAIRVYETLERAGFRADVVGGSVRDFLLGLSPNDFDMTTSATPDEMLSVLSEFRLIQTGVKHGTVTVIADGESIEVTTYRTDGGYLDHRHPDKVTFTKELKDDLARRDFTVNAMCYHPVYGFTDAFGGREDLKNRVIRCVGEPALRFSEDALRILRALRFASALGFSVEEKTAKAIHKLYPLLRDVSAERVYAEWRKLLSGQNAVAVLSEFSDVTAFLFPGAEFSLPTAFASNDFRLCTLQLLWQDPNRAAHFEEMAKRLKTEKSFLDYGVSILSQQNAERNLRRGEYLRLCHTLGVENTKDFLFLCDLSDGENRTEIFEKIIAENPVTKISDLRLNGNDLQKAGYKGVAIGRLLEGALYAVMDGKVENEKSSLLEYIQSI